MPVTELLPITKALYQQMNQLAWLMLGPLFLLSCVYEYAKEPHNFPAWIMLRKLVLTVILLCIFPEISGLISMLTNQIAETISQRHALDVLFNQMKAQSDGKHLLGSFSFLLNADPNVSLLNYFSYAALYLARFIMIALFHFFWSLLLALAPLAILCNLFRSASHVTGHLFRSLIEISSWNIVWQVLGEMLLGLNIVHINAGNYFDAVCFNFFLAIGMVGTPLLVHSLANTGLRSPSALSATSVATFVTTPLKFAKAAGVKKLVPKGGKSK